MSIIFDSRELEMRFYRSLVSDLGPLKRELLNVYRCFMQSSQVAHHSGKLRKTILIEILIEFEMH